MITIAYLKILLLFEKICSKEKPSNDFKYIENVFKIKQEQHKCYKQLSNQITFLVEGIELPLFIRGFIIFTNRLNHFWKMKHLFLHKSLKSANDFKSKKCK